jgi:hypothetical protein
LVTNEAIDMTCSSLIDCIERFCINKESETETVHQMETDNNSVNSKELSSPSSSLTSSQSNNDQIMESLVIEEFGKCLLDIINAAENRKLIEK